MPSYSPTSCPRLSSRTERSSHKYVTSLQAASRTFCVSGRLNHTPSSNFTGATYSTSDQHKDVLVARKQRDHKDICEIFQYLQDYNPFLSEEGALHSIATGVIASDSCNPHEARKVGNAILNKMEGQNAFDFVFRRKDQVERMGLKQVVVDGEKLKVDPQLLFQRLLTV